MTFNNIDEVYELIKQNKEIPDWVVKARTYHKRLKALVYGDGFKELLLTIEHIESEKLAKPRRKYSRSIKDVNAKILEPVNNVYSATGGTKDFDVNPTQKKELIKTLSNIKGGISLESWLHKYWAKDLYVADPNGVILLEWKDDKSYPTYKSIDVIRNYKSNGQQLEYILFEPIVINEKGDKLWRVIDDENDYSIIERQEILTQDEDNSFSHTFGKCPGRVNSDLQLLGQELRLSPIDKIIETEEELLRDRSILSIYKFKNGFSIPYRPKVVCPDCRGTKKIGIEDCKSCDGKGFILDKDVIDEIIIPITLDAEQQPQLPSDFAGFISPDLEIWNQYKEEEARLFNQCFESMWGTRESEARDQTAMAVILNTQPMITRLNAWSDVAQSQEKGFIELLANFYLITKDKDNPVSNIAYGRNYIIQPPEYLLEQYQKSNEAKDPIIIRDRKLSEYITAKYKDDPEQLRIQLIKKDLEPYIHYDIEIINTIYGQKEAQKKGLFPDWWESLTSQDKNKDVKALAKMRDEYFTQQIELMAIVPQPNNNNNNGNSSM